MTNLGRRDWYLTVPGSRELLLRGHRNQRKTCRRKNTSGSSSKGQNESMGKWICDEREDWVSEMELLGQARRVREAEIHFGMTIKEILMTSLWHGGEDGVVLKAARAFIADTESVSCLFCQRSERRSRCWIVTETASSPNRSWVWPCALWVTCPARWSWPSSCRD